LIYSEVAVLIPEGFWLWDRSDSAQQLRQNQLLRGPGPVDDPVNSFVVTEFRILAHEKGLGRRSINHGSA